MKGVLVTTKRTVFKQGNKISSKIENLNPVFLKELQIITQFRVDRISPINKKKPVSHEEKKLEEWKEN